MYCLDGFLIKKGAFAPLFIVYQLFPLLSVVNDLFRGGDGQKVNVPLTNFYLWGEGHSNPTQSLCYSFTNSREYLVLDFTA